MRYVSKNANRTHVNSWQWISCRRAFEFSGRQKRSFCRPLKWFVMRNLQAIGNCPFDYCGHRVFCYSPFLAVVRLQPYWELFLPFARIASTTAKGDVFSCNDFFIVDDVFPACCRLFGNVGGFKWGATIYARHVSRPNFGFQPSRDIPVICHGRLF